MGAFFVAGSLANSARLSANQAARNTTPNAGSNSGGSLNSRCTNAIRANSFNVRR